MLEVEAFGAIVSDIKMPGMDGYELVRAVRARQRETGPRVLAVSVTGMAEGDEGAQSREAGFDAHLQRPIDPDRLVETIHRLRLRRSSGELPLLPASCTTT
jgi:CheY-like chemotaxis protein